jgi:hypothetical protein
VQISSIDVRIGDISTLQTQTAPLRLAPCSHRYKTVFVYEGRGHGRESKIESYEINQMLTDRKFTCLCTCVKNKTKDLIGFKNMHTMQICMFKI